MCSLVYLSALKVVQNEDAACDALEDLPPSLYELLFKVAFKEKKKLLLLNLVQIWPYPIMRIQKILEKCWFSKKNPLVQKCRICYCTLSDDSMTENIIVLIVGLIKYIQDAITYNPEELPNRKLRQMDFSGFIENDNNWNIHVMNIWAFAVTHVRSCIFEELNSQREARSQGEELSPVITYPPEAHLDFLIDFLVVSGFQGSLKAILQDNINSPLTLLCRDFLILNLSVQDTAELLVLLDPIMLRRVDLRSVSMEMKEVGWLMPKFSRFQNMHSLKLPHIKVQDQWWLNAELKADFDTFVTELSKLNRLREFVVCDFPLSDLLEHLLSGLQDPLESLELSGCYLTNKDLAYLVQSHHSTRLIKLDLSGNTLRDKLDSFLELMKAASSSLICLNISNCKFQDTHFNNILPYLSDCNQLFQLCLFDNPLSTESLRSLLERRQHKLSKLHMLSLPVFLDCRRDPPQDNLFQEPELDEDKFIYALQSMNHLLKLMGEAILEFPTQTGVKTHDYFDFS